MLKPLLAVVLVVCICAVIVGVRLAFVSPAIPLLPANNDEQLSAPDDTETPPPLKVAENVMEKVAEDIGAPGWIERDHAPVELATYIPNLEEQAFLSLNRAQLESVLVGDRLKLWIPQEQQMLAILINTRDTLASGNVLVKGFLDGDPDYPFVMTIGQTSTFATISTREAVYSLRGNRSVAWIASSAALKQHFPQKEQDYVIPKNS